MSTVKIVLGSVLLLALLAGAYYAGNSMGYAKGYAVGYAYHGYANSSTNAYVTLSTIEMMAARKNASAKEDLEQRLDTEIVEHWAGIVSLPPDAVIPVRQDEEAAKKLMSKVAAYRKKHPTRSTNQDVRNAVEAIVARYYEVPAPVPQKRTRR